MTIFSIHDFNFYISIYELSEIHFYTKYKIWIHFLKWWINF